MVGVKWGRRGEAGATPKNLYWPVWRRRLPSSMTAFPAQAPEYPSGSEGNTCNRQARHK